VERSIIAFRIIAFHLLKGKMSLLKNHVLARVKQLMSFEETRNIDLETKEKITPRRDLMISKSWFLKKSMVPEPQTLILEVSLQFQNPKHSERMYTPL
jgi:hypothetical protein